MTTIATDALADEVGGALDGNRTLPASWYTDPAILQLEQERVFRRNWAPFATGGALDAPGDYVTGEVGGVPILVARGKDHELRGFVNVCRHRAHIVAQGCGNERSFQCPYHAWTYGLDGRLRGVPRAPAGFPLDELGLKPVQVGAWGDVVFVNVDTGARSFDDAFAELRAFAADHGMDLEGARLRATEDWVFACNWKVFYDNSAECYHCPTVHPGFSAEYHITQDRYELTARDGFVHHLSPRKSRADDETRDWEMTSWWPNWSMATGERPGVTLLWAFTPIGVDRTAIKTWFLATGDVSDDEIAEEVAWWRAIVYGEDRLACESVQQGLASGAVADGPLVLGSEFIIQHFQRQLRTALTAPATSDSRH